MPTSLSPGAGPGTVKEIRLPRLTPWQQRVATNAKRFNVLACGRRSGKTTLGEDRLIHPALAGFPVAWFSPTYKMLSEVWRTVCDRLQPAVSTLRESEKRIELITGGAIDMWSLDSPESVLGRAYKRIIVDEAAVVPNLEQTWTRILRPELTDFQGDAWFLSTPKGLNYFYTLHGMAAGSADWTAWRFPTRENPLIPPEEIDDAQRQLPERVFAQEYLAEFLEDGGAVFRNVKALASAVRQDQPWVDPRDPLARHTYVFGIDWAKSVDFSVVIVLDLDLRAAVYMGRWNQVDYALQLARIKMLADTFEPAVILAEKAGVGDPLVDQLRKVGARWTPDGRLPVRGVDMTNIIKQQLVEDLAAAFDVGRIQILNDEVLTGELLSFTSERLPSGKLRYAAPEGMHDDCVIALALAWSAVRRTRPKPRLVPTGTSVYRV